MTTRTATILADAAALATTLPAATPAQIAYLADLLDQALGGNSNSKGWAEFTLSNLNRDGFGLTKRGASNLINSAKDVLPHY